MLWLDDPKTERKSATLTIACLGTFICLAKLAVSGMVLGGVAFSIFTGSEFGVAMAALWAPYSWRKYADRDTDIKSME